MSDHLPLPLLRLLQGVACVAILMWGIKMVSQLLVLLLMALLLAYAFVPLPRWLMQRLRLSEASALLSTVAILGTLNLATIALLYDSVIRIKEKAPLYHEHFMVTFDKVMVFANAHGFSVGNISAAKLSSSSQILEFARVVVREAGSFLGDGILISVLAWIFLIEMVGQEGTNKSFLAEKLDYYGSGVQRYIGISAELGLVTALANLVVLIALGVDFPVLWCVLYFFFHFIPNFGFVLALIPPSVLALLMLGWKKALLVVGGLIVTQLLTDYGLSPVLMKKGVDVSFLEIMVSLMFWGFLLGPAGAILAIPLTLTLRKFVEQFSSDVELDEHAVGMTSSTQPVVEGGALAGYRPGSR